MSTKPVETIAITEFKASCFAVLGRVRRTGVSIVVTRRGKPVAEVIPLSPATLGDSWLGAMAGTASIVGDLVRPSHNGDDWEAVGQ